MRVDMNRYRSFGQLALVFIALLGACQPLPKSMGSKGNVEDMDLGYDLGFQNNTAERFSDMTCTWTVNGRKVNSGPGILSPSEGHDHGKTAGPWPRPIPKSVRLTWKTPDGKEHRKEVEVAKHVKNADKFRGTVYLKFLKDGTIKVVALTDAEQSKMAAEQIPYP